MQTNFGRYIRFRKLRCRHVRQKSKTTRGFISQPQDSISPRTPFVGLGLLSLFAVVTHGYHPGADDAAIYVPAIKKVADPALYPYAAEFFQGQAHVSIFPELIGYSAIFTRVSVDWVILAWHVFSVALLLTACWRLAAVCFRNSWARWGGVALIAGTLSVPIAGTALVIMDPYLTARSLSTPGSLFAIGFCLQRKYSSAALWLLLTVAIHPLMGVFAVGCCLAIWFDGRVGAQVSSSAVAASFLGPLWLEPAKGIYREILFTRPYLFVSNWMWYEWAGVFAPLGILWWVSCSKVRGTRPGFCLLSRALVPFGLLFTVAGSLIASSERLQNFARFQPMRAFQMVYIVMFIMLGGLLGEYVLQRKPWRWAVLFVPLACGMWAMQVDAFPNSAHLEWPDLSSNGNPWTCAFLWIRLHTPKDAVFAMDPNYMLASGEETQGFRAIAERSALADFAKDGGVVAVFPQLADHWKAQVEAQRGWNRFARADFAKLAGRFPVTWILTARPSPAGFVCPYQNATLTVCKLPK